METTADLPRRLDPPRVGVVVLNWNGRAHVIRCLAHLSRTDWPAAALEVVVVDNASTDGSDRDIERLCPQVRLIRSPSNLGFPGNNLGISDLCGVEYVALINNDAFVEPGWLTPLVAELESEPGLGAVCPKIVFDQPFAEIDVTMASRDERSRGGVRVSGLEVDGVDAWNASQFVAGFSTPTAGSRAEPLFVRAVGGGTIRVPVVNDGPGCEVRIRLATDLAGEVRLESAVDHRIEMAGPRPRWFTVRVAPPGETVIQNAGSHIERTGYAGDRAFMELDDGRFDEPIDVFGWCGGGVLLRYEYLEDVGLFDERFFLYYEDTDLSWRGRLRGWNYRYVPDSVIRHLHAASTGEGSGVFQHYVERNRLIMLTKNAPRRLVVSSLYYYIRMVAGYLGWAGYRAARGRPAGFGVPMRRIWSLLDYLRLLPGVLVDRRRNRSARVIDDDQITSWMVAQ